MRILKCAKLDFMKTFCTDGAILILLFLFVFIFQGFRKPSSNWMFVYALSITLIYSTMPFFVNIGNQDAFTRILPVTVRERVYGRYLFGSLLVAAGTLLGVAGQLYQAIRWGLALGMDHWLIDLCIFSLGLLMMTIQFLALYLLRIKNVQLLSILRMLPAFALMFLGNGLTDFLQEGSRVALVKWILANRELTAAALVGLAILLTLLCAFFSALHEQKKI